MLFIWDSKALPTERQEPVDKRSNYEVLVTDTVSEVGGEDDRTWS